MQNGARNLRNDGLQRSNARCDFEEHGPEEVGIRRHLPGTLNVAIIPVKPVKSCPFPHQCGGRRNNADFRPPYESSRCDRTARLCQK